MSSTVSFQDGRSGCYRPLGGGSRHRPTERLALLGRGNRKPQGPGIVRIVDREQLATADVGYGATDRLLHTGVHGRPGAELVTQKVRSVANLARGCTDATVQRGSSPGTG